MDLYIIFALNKYLLLLSALSSFLLGSIVYLRDKKSIVHKIFAFTIIDIGVWALFSFLAHLFPYTFWINNVIIFFGFNIITFFLLFVNHFPEDYKRPNKSFYFLMSAWEIYLIVQSLSTNGYLLDNPVRNGLPTMVFSNWYYITTLFAFPFLSYFLLQLRKKYKASEGLEKMQLKYFFMGFVSFSFFATLWALVLVFFNLTQYTVAYFAPSSALLLVAFSSYAMLRHRLMDIRLAFVKSVVFSIIIFTLASIYFFVVFFLKDFLSLFFNIGPNVTFIVTGLTIAFGFAPFKNFIEKSTDKIFFKGRYDSQEVLKKINTIMKSTLDLDKLSDDILSTLKRELRLAKVSMVLFHDKKSYAFSQGFHLEEYYEKLLLMTSGASDLLATEELHYLDKNKEFLRNKDISVIAPLKVKNQLTGLLVLGDKRSGDMFTNQDINFVMVLSPQISLALANAFSYSQVVKDREQIRKLLKERESLDKMKDEFIAIASHEVNTPLSIVQGYLSLIMEDKKTSHDSKLKTYAASAFDGIKRINALMTTLMNASKIVSGKPMLNMEVIDLKKVIKEIFDKYTPYAKHYNLQFKYLNDLKDEIKVKADESMIKAAMEQLVDNAFKFTPASDPKKKTKQAVTVTTEKEKDMVVFRVKDTGIGIKKDVFPHLFERFYQADSSFSRSAEGTGMGLFLAQSILRIHGGKISVKSAEGEGSEFWFSLPMEDG